MRARADDVALVMMTLASAGFASNQWVSFSWHIFCTKDRTDALPSRVLVWPSNCGSASLTEITAARPSRMSSPVRPGSLSLSSFLSLAYLLTTLVRAARKPSSWVPPSWVLMVLAKVCTDSE
ncbi:Secreted protein [Mycobacterium simiae]